ncbi:MAG: DUF541 domain-containing protein [Dehalococcoidia bacterium]|nr:DUF541 domain-containing protein [Dehalococcoidia bacterium]
MKDARERAESLAKEAGVTLGKSHSISESSGGVPIPFGGPQLAEARAAGDVPTPLSAGQSEVTINVSAVFAID